MQTGGRERLQSIEVVRAAMRREERLVPRTQAENDIGRRIVNDEPERARARGKLVLVPPLPPEEEPAPLEESNVVPIRSAEVA